MGKIASIEKKFMGDVELTLDIDGKPLKLKVTFGEDKADAPETTIKSFYYSNDEAISFKLKTLYAKVKELIVPLKDLPELPSEGPLGAILDADITLHEIYGDASGQFGLSIGVKFTKNPFEDLFVIKDLGVKLNLARVFEGASGIIPAHESILLKKLPQDKTYSKIEGIISKNWLDEKDADKKKSLPTLEAKKYSLIPASGGNSHIIEEKVSENKAISK